jgi:uncharacterized protein YggU (UPF0235/DUF167 family)
MAMIEIRVWVKPGSRKGPLVEDADRNAGRNVDLVVYLRQQAVDGRANDELVGLLGDHFGVATCDIQIVSGFGSRFKRVAVG